VAAANHAAPAASATLFPKGPSRIWTDIDLDREGKQLGYLRLNVSSHERAASFIPIPIAVFRNGEGPRILLLGGVHGDEFEGQIMLMKLIRTLDIQNVRGQLIILPAANAPAAFSGRRTSPVDGKNLNREYPGDPRGTPTEEIAYFLDNALLPRVDYLLDFHSASQKTYIVPSAHVYYSPEPEKFARLTRMLEVFGMPDSVILQGLVDHDKKAIGACDRLGVLRFSSELGGGGGITIDALQRAEKGLGRLLHHLGALREPITQEPAPAIKLIRRLPNSRYVYAMAAGHFEPYVDIGAEVTAGQPAGAIHFPQEPWREPVIAKFTENATVHAIRRHACTEIGDMLFMLHVPWQAPAPATGTV
jgi:predicted deacylase